MNLTGTLTNTGNTFTYNAVTGSWNLLGGTVEGGALVFQAGQSLLISSNANNRLDGVAITGDLLLDTRTAVVRIRNGLNVSGVVQVSGDSASLAFEGNQTWSAGTVVFEGTTGGRRIIEAVSSSTTLTLGAGSTVHGGRRHGGKSVLRQLLRPGQQRPDRGGRVGPKPRHPQSRDADQQRFVADRKREDVESERGHRIGPVG